MIEPDQLDLVIERGDRRHQIEPSDRKHLVGNLLRQRAYYGLAPGSRLTCSFATLGGHEDASHTSLRYAQYSAPY